MQQKLLCWDNSITFWWCYLPDSFLILLVKNLRIAFVGFNSTAYYNNLNSLVNNTSFLPLQHVPRAVTLVTMYGVVPGRWDVVWMKLALFLFFFLCFIFWTTVAQVVYVHIFSSITCLCLGLPICALEAVCKWNICFFNFCAAVIFLLYKYIDLSGKFVFSTMESTERSDDLYNCSYLVLNAVWISSDKNYFDM